MNAQAPSDVEQATIDRLGIFDEERFAEIVDHFEEGAPCAVIHEGTPCASPATHVAVCGACGGKAATLCAEHASFIERTEYVMKHSACGSARRHLFRVVEL